MLQWPTITSCTHVVFTIDTDVLSWLVWSSSRTSREHFRTPVTIFWQAALQSSHQDTPLSVSRLLAAEVCASAVLMLDKPCSEVAWRVPATHSIRQFPLHFPSHVSPCAITFQLESTSCCAPLRHSPQCMLVRRARAEARIMPETYQTFCAATTRYSWQKAGCLAHITLPLIIRQQLKCFSFSFSNTLKSIKYMKITFNSPKKKHFRSL